VRLTRGKLFVLVPVIAVAVYVFVDRREAAAQEARLAAIASKIAGRPVEVRCQGRFSAAFDVTAESGTVRFDARGRPADWTDLKRGICTALARFGSEHRAQRFGCVHEHPLACDLAVLRSIHSLETLAHEAWHLAGHVNEATAECYALQRIAFVAAALGAPPEQGTELARAAFVVLYPRMPEEYRSAECRDGGSLDLTPTSSVFP
jgi:hypothetical protein